MRVLFVDNDRNFREITTDLMTTWGYDVSICSSERTAKEYVQETPSAVDIALLDMRMELQHSGLNIVKLLGAYCPGVPSMVATAFSNLDDERQCLEAHAFKYIDKSHMTELLQTALLVAEEQRLIRLREHTYGALSEWWLKNGGSVLDQIRKADPKKVKLDQMRSLLYRFMPQTWSVLKSGIEDVPLPYAASPRIAFTELSPRSPYYAVSLDRPNASVASARIRTSLKAFPDPAPVLNHLGKNGAHPPFQCIRDVKYGWAITQITAKECQLPSAPMIGMNNLLSGIKSDLDDIEISCFAHDLTSLGAVSWVSVDEKDNCTTLTVKMRCES